MRARYHHFKAPDGAADADGSSSFQSLQTLLGKRKAQEAPAASTGEPQAAEGVHETTEVDVVMVEAEAAPSDQSSGSKQDGDGTEAARDGSAPRGDGAEGSNRVGPLSFGLWLDPAASLPQKEMRGNNADAGDPPTFSEAEDIVLADNGTPADAETLTTLRRQTRARLGRIARLEQACASTITLLHSLMAASASTARQLDRAGALAMLSGKRVRFVIKRSAFSIGRPTSSHGAVDVDLGREGDASRVSRHQARVALRPDGAFAVTNCGRRKLHINGCQVDRGQSAVMQHLSLLEVGGIRLLLHINHSAVRRLLARSSSFGDFPGS
ncbi:hypothetical protein COCSUDRAFT_66884 [Coccomyxa subellipsoidea C-169]|uniref:FHA domain-containing protein n=1 Tax=Coccomyxa subellipsoidea (strain C-169) TaxID=574566 RepID=I0YSR5_COCSC|nr:hypothetical protein COCSUDRAFT_66884 [Coccomyxa subellipsoidea C-169]EIE21434.1 hypothetical protein COCSUDRAFT_66884 [Coccomyxa subellipsoidea C-169]|eukprot:XP_005645978.1 hypothetical protein COCSUDRAFT_66884 [Coccomyxa subellipsoidea C-169]